MSSNQQDHHLDDTLPPLGVLAGAGEYPRLLAEGARRAGRRIVGIGFRGAEEPAFIALCDHYTSFRVGAIEGPAAFFKQHEVKECVLTGQIKPSCIYTLWPDATARRLLAELDRRNAHTIFGTVCRFIESQGIRPLPSTIYMEESMPPVGHIAGPPPSEEMLALARRGLAHASTIADLDIGQSLVMQGAHVLCVEGYKGTNECIAQSAHSEYAGEKILCKITKHGHDMRFDVPCIGIGTVRHCLRAGIRHIVIEAERTIMLQREEVHTFCQREGISLFALPRPIGEQIHAHAAKGEDDEAHAGYLAQQLHSHGIGASAAVCDGVVIAVEDHQGLPKCIKRAAAYMRRLRWARLINTLLHYLLGYKKSQRAAPLVLASTRPLDAQEQKLLRRYGIKWI